jgi:hypothetical protein
LAVAAGWSSRQAQSSAASVNSLADAALSTDAAAEAATLGF